MTVEYSNIKSQRLFYSNPSAMRWRKMSYQGVVSAWVLGANQEPDWVSEATYQVEPIPTPVCYQAHILVPAPERVAPMKGTDYYVPSNTCVERWKWCDIECDEQFLSAGLVYLTEINARARRQAWLKLEEGL